MRVRRDLSVLCNGYRG